MLIGRKNFGFSGCWGIAAWEIKDTGKILTVFWSVPFDRNLYTNWMGVGIWNKQEFDKHGIKKIFDVMWNADLGPFQRKNFHDDLEPIRHQARKFTILGKMDAEQKSKITVTLIPNFLKDAFDEPQ